MSAQVDALRTRAGELASSAEQLAALVARFKLQDDPEVRSSKVVPLRSAA
jgi:hypothetical protein